MIALSLPLRTSESPADQYDRWSTRVFVLLLITYTMFFLVRQNFALAAPYLTSSLSIDKTQIGTIMSVSLMIFSVGKLICGFFIHTWSPKAFLAVGLAGSSLMNVLASQSTSVTSLTLIWSCNAAFQSLAWPQCIRLLNDWCSKQQLGTRWGILSLAYQFGSVVVFSCFALLIEWYGWQASFLFPGVMGIAVGVSLLALPLHSPTELGLQRREARFGLSDVAEEKKTGTGRQELLAISKEILCNRHLWMVSLATFFIYAVRTGFCFWAPTYLSDRGQASVTTIGTYMLGFEAAGAAGGLCAGWLSDAVFNGRRAPVALLYFAGIFTFLIALCLLPGTTSPASAFCLAGLGFTITGPQIMAGTATFDVSSKKAAVAANGFTGLFSGLGSALISGATIGFLAQFYGWSVVFMVLAACAAIAAWLFYKIS